MSSTRTKIIPSESSQLVEWVQKWAQKLEISHLETPLHDLLSSIKGYSFIHTRLKFRGHIFRGNGSDKDPELSLLKSIVEAIERAVTIGILSLENSTGTAAHFSSDLAIRSAELELLERDSFFTHFLTMTPFIPVPNSTELSGHIKALNSDGIVVQFFELQSLKKDISTVVCHFSLPVKGILRPVISASASPSKSQAMEKSFAEALSLSNTLLHAGMEEKMPTDKEFGPWDHIQMIFSPSHADWFRETHLSGKNTNSLPESPIQPPVMKTEVVSLKDLPFEDCGLHIVKVTSPDVQNAWWGLPKREIVNFKRLQLLKSGLQEEDIPWNRYHLFG